MMGEIETINFATAQDLQNRVSEYNVARYVYECLSDEDSANTIIDLLLNHGLLEEEEEPNDSN